MITLSATLTAEQKKAYATPYVELKAKEKMGSVNRLRWTRHYTGTEAILRHAACMPADGSLLRARAVVNGANHDLTYSRVTSPGAGSTYSSWSVLVATIAQAPGFAFATTGAKVAIAYVDPALRDIYVKESTDSGATYAAAVLADTAPADVTHLAMAFKDADTLILFYAAGGVLRYLTRTAGAWGADAAWTNTASTITGLAAYYAGDYNLAIAGTAVNGDYKVWTCLYGDGYSQGAGTWSALLELMSANSGSLVTYSHTAIAKPDVTRMSFLEEYGGTATYSLPQTTHTLPADDFVDNRWREPWPLNIASATGVAIANSTTKVWLTTTNGVWSATIAPADLDMTAHLHALTAHVRLSGGSIIALVRNDAGTYLESASGKGAAWIGCELRLGLGYQTTAGNEASTHLSFWIDAYGFTSEPGKARLVLYASSPWEVLKRWRARRQFTWTAGSTSLQNIIAFVLARAGFALSAVGASAQLSALQPAFTIKPNETAYNALLRLLAMVQDRIRWQNATAIIGNLQAGDASGYAFGSAHVIKKASYKSTRSAADLIPLTAYTQDEDADHQPRPEGTRLNPLPSRIQVLGTAVFGQAYDWTQIELTADSVAQIYDLNLTTAAQVADQAAAALREATMASRADVLTIPPHCGLEIHDVVDVTDSRAGLTAARRRVRHMQIAYDTTNRGKFEQQIILGEV